MLRVLCFFLLFLQCAQILAEDAQEDKNKVFELSANNVTSEGSLAIAQGNAFILSEDLYMYADKITYDRETKFATLEGNVRIYRGKSLFVDASRVEMDMQTKLTILRPAYLQSENGIWVSADELKSEDKMYRFKKAMISGCDIQFPIWHLNATSGIYNSQKEFASAWNSRLYIGSLPIFYLPYFTFPTSTKRRSGLLIPELGSTSRDGFIYMQPLYIAPYAQWDLTLTSQYRSERGNGGNYEFRIADEKNSIARLQIGYFKQHKEYVKDYKLYNRYISGFEFDYSRSGVLEPLFTNYKDNFYASVIYMNDLEYMRLKKLNGVYNTRLNTSRINYFGQNGNNYVGVYFRYFLDLSQADNFSTLQTLPNVQYHHYIDTFFLRNLYYSLDVQSKNITRQEGYTYLQNSISLPVGVTTTLLKDYASVNGKLDLFASQIGLNNIQGILEPTSRAQIENKMDYAYANYEIALNSDVAKAYKNFFHSIHFEGIYNALMYRYASKALDSNAYEAYSALAKSMSSSALAMYWNPNDITDLSATQSKMDLKFSTYFYNNSGKELLFYRAYQRIFTQDHALTLNQSLRQEIGANLFNGLTLTTNLFYSHYVKAFEEASVTLNFNKFGISGNLNYFFKLDSNVLRSGVYNANANNSSFLRASLRYNFGYFQFSGNMGYDVQNEYLRDWYVILSRDIRCFGIALKIAADVRPILTTNVDNPINTISNQYIKIEFRFVPLAGIGFTQRLQSQ